MEEIEGDALRLGRVLASERRMRTKKSEKPSSLRITASPSMTADRQGRPASASAIPACVRCNRGPVA